MTVFPIAQGVECGRNFVRILDWTCFTYSGFGLTIKDLVMLRFGSL